MDFWSILFGAGTVFVTGILCPAVINYLQARRSRIDMSIAWHRDQRRSVLSELIGAFQGLLVKGKTFLALDLAVESVRMDAVAEVERDGGHSAEADHAHETAVPELMIADLRTALLEFRHAQGQAAAAIAAALLLEDDSDLQKKMNGLLDIAFVEPPGPTEEDRERARLQLEACENKFTALRDRLIGSHSLRALLGRG